MDKTSITVTKSTLERFNELRERCKTDHTPAPSADSMLNSLMDEWESGGPKDPRDPAERLPEGFDSMADVLDELAELKELVDRMPDRTAENVERRLR